MALALLPVARVAASASQVTIIEDDRELVFSTPKHRGKLLDEAKALGVDVVKIRVDWRSVAPARESKHKPSGFNGADSSQYPGGVWANYDDVLRAIVARGMKPLVMLGGSSPNWGGSKSNRGGRPKPSEFRRFVQAVGSRYSGSFSGLMADPVNPLPRVDMWSDWNEPNLKGWITPQYSHGRAASPRIYRALVYAAHDGLAASGHGGDQQLIGELMPGSQSGKANNKVSPIRFLREMACLDSHYHRFTGDAAKKRGCNHFKKIPGTGVAFHPYTFSGGPDVPMQNADDASIGQLGRIVLALDRIANAHRLVTKRMPLWITEFGIQTRPPDPYAPPVNKVPGYLGESEWFAYRNPRVASFSQYPFLDDPLGRNGGGFPVRAAHEQGQAQAQRLPRVQAAAVRAASLEHCGRGVRRGPRGLPGPGDQHPIPRRPLGQFPHAARRQDPARHARVLRSGLPGLAGERADLPLPLLRRLQSRRRRAPLTERRLGAATGRSASRG